MNIGTEISGYKVISHKGRGNYGEVDEVLEGRSETKYILKSIHSEVLAAHNIISAIQVIFPKILLHQNITTFKRYFNHNELHYFVFEIVDGVPLTSLIAQGLTFDELKSIFFQLADGMIFAHSKITFHRNLHPGNILVTENCVVKICDFAIAYLFHLPHNHNSRRYLAPEVRNGQNCSKASDVFSLGVLFFEMITNGQRFNNFSHFQNALKIKIPSIQPNNARFIAQWVKTALEEDINNRTQTVDLLKSGFDHIIENQLFIYSPNPVFFPKISLSAKKSGLNFVEVSGGEFEMNIQKANSEYNVVVSSFYIATTPVSKKLWKTKFIAREEFSDDNLPVTRVTWTEAVEFCNYLSNRHEREKCYSKDLNGNYTCDFRKNGFRLPTEAEWEFVARQMMLQPNYDIKTEGGLTFNNLGIEYNTGDFYEWCWDWYGNSFIPGTYKNPAGPTTGWFRILRGLSSDHFLKIKRYHDTPESQSNNYGLRLVCSIIKDEDNAHESPLIDIKKQFR